VSNTRRSLSRHGSIDGTAAEPCCLAKPPSPTGVLTLRISRKDGSGISKAQFLGEVANIGSKALGHGVQYCKADDKLRPTVFVELVEGDSRRPKTQSLPVFINRASRVYGRPPCEAARQMDQAAWRLRLCCTMQTSPSRGH
jgi:hypothetical protein